jgi:outer membrane protein assembly factor BamB
MKRRHLLTSLSATLLLNTLATAGDWPQWRGPARDDISTETGLLKQWPADGPKQLWVTDIAGLGYSGYSIQGDTLYTMGAFDAEECVLAISTADGTEQWKTTVGPLYTNGWGDGPRSTPTLDGDHLYAIAARGNLVCLNKTDGKLIWEASLTEDLGGKLQSWGYTESPLIHGDLVICTPGGTQGTMAAFEKNTGKLRWQTKNWIDDAQYASPIAVTHNGSPQIIQLTGKTIAGIAPADGKILWKTDFPGKTAVIPTPIYQEGQVFVAAGYGVGCKSVRISPTNSVEVLYENTDMINHHGGVILYQGNLYGYSDKAGWTCMELATGNVRWTEKAALKKGAIHAADNMFYLLEEDSGTVVLIEANPDAWVEKGRFTLAPQTTQRNPKGKVWVHPVVSHGKLYLRDQELLHCYQVTP